MIIRLESSLDDRLFFAGGFIQTPQGLYPKLFAITFDDKLKPLNDIELMAGNNRGQGKVGVSSLKRIRDKQVLLVGTLYNLFVVEWTGYQFSVLNTITDMHSCRRL